VGSGVGRRDTKRPRKERTPRERERERERKKTPEVVKKEDPAVHSGSEEGEIEED
jgi:pre-mRNA-processing factor 40